MVVVGPGFGSRSVVGSPRRPGRLSSRVPRPITPKVLARALRSEALSFEKARSMGLRPGE